MKIKGRLLDIHLSEIYRAEIDFSEKGIKSIKRCKSSPDVYLLPGLIDAHVHIESSMVTPGAFAMMAARHGTIGVVSDPHEIANVMGMNGIDFMINDSKKVPLYFWYGAPSCVPATNFETNGALIGIEEIRILLERKEIKYLSEMMNFPGVISGDEKVIDKIEVARSLGKPIDGHAPGLTGMQLTKYIGSGISTDHECSTMDEALEKITLGMKILIREGSAAKNLESLKDLFKMYPEKVMLCSDDIHPEMLQKRHINKLVSRLINEGYDTFNVIRSCTFNPVMHYGLEAGLLRSGDSADFIVVDDPGKMNILETWIRGKKIYSEGKIFFDYLKGEPINKFNSSEIEEKDIKVRRSGQRIRVIKASDGELLTGSFFTSSGNSEFITSDTKNDILKIVVKERYNDQSPSVAFINGFGLRNGAFGSSVAHDSHNIICVGTDDKSITECINEITRLKGGLAVCSEGKVSSLRLNIGGIMSDDSCDNVADAYEKLTRIVSASGCRIAAPFMTLSFMALLVIPELKISDRGLFDGKKFEFTNLFED
ncbi:MAG: adenine deaminase [Bacteroidales bacterium]